MIFYICVFRAIAFFIRVRRLLRDTATQNIGGTNSGNGACREKATALHGNRHPVDRTGCADDDGHTGNGLHMRLPCLILVAPTGDWYKSTGLLTEGRALIGPTT